MPRFVGSKAESCLFHFLCRDSALGLRRKLLMNNNKTGPGSSGGAGSEGTFTWMADLTPAQWKIFGVTFSAWTFAAMNILLFTFAAVSIAEVFSLSPKTVGWLFSVMLFSTALGGILFGVVSDYLGRVKAIMLTIFFYSFFSFLIWDVLRHISGSSIFRQT